jgi:hypothetical protein
VQVAAGQLTLRPWYHLALLEHSYWAVLTAAVLAAACTLLPCASDQVLQLLWKAQPDEAAKQPMPYQGRVNVLLGDDPYYEMDPESQGKRSWVQLRVGNIKGLLNF